MKKIVTAFAILTLSAASLQAQVTRKVLIEEFTGTWCPNCPDGHTILQGIEAANPDRTVVVGMHNNDAYTIPYEQAMESAFAVAAFPRAAIDRVIYSGGNANVMSRSYWAGAVADRLNISSPVELSIQASVNTTSRVVTAKVDYTFKANVNEETHLTCVLLEDSIQASQSGATGIYNHMDVCRALLSGDNWGDANHPSSVTNGQAFTKTYSYTVPAAVNLNNMRVVAFINKKIGTTPIYGTGTEILNSEVTHVSSSPLSIHATTTNQVEASVSPNPFSDITAIDFTLIKDEQVHAFVTDLRGVVIKELVNEKRSAGKHAIYWGGNSSTNASLPNGIYYISILTKTGRISKPVVLQR